MTAAPSPTAAKHSPAAILLALALLTLYGLAQTLPAAQNLRDLRLAMLPTATPLTEAGFASNAGHWRLGLMQAHDEIRPNRGLTGFSLEGSLIAIGVQRGLGFVAGPDQPHSIWNRMAVEGTAGVGFVYGTTHGGRNRVNGLCGGIRGRFALQLIRKTTAESAQANALTGFFGLGVDYNLLTMTGAGANLDMGSSVTHIDAGLQAALVLNPAWSIEPFLQGAAGWQSTGVHQGTTVVGRDRLFYRVDVGAEFKLQLRHDHPDDRLGFQGILHWNDAVGWGATVAIVLHRGF